MFVNEQVNEAYADILEEAKTLVTALINDLALNYGGPLYTRKVVMTAKWPDDPETLSPEEMHALVSTRGEEAVNQWLYEHFQRKAEEELVEE